MRITGIKDRIQNEVIDLVRTYTAENNLTDIFLDPYVGYAQTKDPLFLAFFEKGWTMHPKEIYRPGNTVIIHYLPFSEKVTKSNKIGGEISKEWIKAYDSAIFLSALINDRIKDILESLGRLASLTNLPGDWNHEKDGPNWSHKLAAYVAGMGDFGIAGSFKAKLGSGGRLGSVITEYVMDQSRPITMQDHRIINSIIDEIEKSHLFMDYPHVKISETKIFRCPAQAVTASGVDRDKCRAYCAAQGQIVPSPDVCGKCFD